MDKYEKSVDFDNKIRQIYIRYKESVDEIKRSKVFDDNKKVNSRIDLLMTRLKDEMIFSADQGLELMTQMLVINEKIEELKGNGSLQEFNFNKMKCQTDLTSVTNLSTRFSTLTCYDYSDESSDDSCEENDIDDIAHLTDSDQINICSSKPIGYLQSVRQRGLVKSLSNPRDSGFYEFENDSNIDEME